MGRDFKSCIKCLELFLDSKEFITSFISIIVPQMRWELHNNCGHYVVLWDGCVSLEKYQVSAFTHAFDTFAKVP